MESESERAQGRVGKGMKVMMHRMLAVLAILGVAGMLGAQWRHFGDSAPASSVTTAQASPAPAAVPSANRTASAMSSQMVSLHNAVRARVKVGPLAWSDELAGVAQEWANHLIANGQFVHSHNPNYGENLYEIQGAPATPNMVVKAWADEVTDYDYKANSCVASKMCGHYTQMVWASTTQVGCAVAKGGNREVWVCEYNPPGNWEGRKPY